MTLNRQKIGLIFSYDERWIAGAYYVINLVEAIAKLPENEQPTLVIFTHAEKDFNRLKQTTNYPFLEMRLIQSSRFLPGVKKSLRARFKKYFGINVLEDLPDTSGISLIFPVNYRDLKFFHKAKRKIYWIPDFQEHFYPQFFSGKDVARRKEHQRKLSESESEIIFSSNTALRHYYTLFPANRSRNKVMRFAVQHRDINRDREFLAKQYQLTSPYFICSNQFWAHKNHRLVLEAAKVLKQTHPSFQVLMTGAPADFRNPEFYNSLLQYTREADLEQHVRFLGLIPRDHQLGLMDGAIAIIQPSLFEGWSTVIEDGKSLNQYILASQLDIHEEQLQGYPNYGLFDPANPHDLSGQMRTALTEKPKRDAYDYSKNIIDRETKTGCL